MAEAVTRLPVKTEEKQTNRPTALAEWRPFETMRREIDRLFDDFSPRAWHKPFGRAMVDIEPFWRGEMSWGNAPAVDVVEKENAYEIAAELPGMDESNINVKFSDGVLTIKGEKKEEKEEKKKDYYMRNAGLAHSSARSKCPMALMPRRSRRPSKTVCSR